MSALCPCRWYALNRVSLKFSIAAVTLIGYDFLVVLWYYMYHEIHNLLSYNLGH